MATTDASARVTDRRQLPVEEIKEHGEKFWTALWAEDEEEIKKLFNEWMDKSGYDQDQPFKFSIKARKQYWDVDFYITCRANLNGREYELTRSSGSLRPPYDDTEGAFGRAGAGALMGIELAVSSLLRKLFDEIIFPDRDIDFRKLDTLFMLGQKEV
jgi:hypothetical protein